MKVNYRLRPITKAARCLNLLYQSNLRWSPEHWRLPENNGRQSRTGGRYSAHCCSNNGRARLTGTMRPLDSCARVFRSTTTRSLAIPIYVSAATENFRERPDLGFSDCLMLEIARKAGHLPLGT